MANTRAHVAISLDPHARGFVGSGRGGGRVGTGEKESRRTEEEEEEEGRVYKEQEEEGRNEGRGNGEGRRLDGVKKNEVHGRNALRGERERGGKKGGRKNRKEKRKRRRGRNVEQGEISSVETMCVMCTRYVKEGRREGKRARGGGSELWQHMRARDSHGAPFVRVSATQLVTVCTYV